METERQRPPFNDSFSQVSSSANSASFQVPAVKECFNVSDPCTSGISRSYAEALIADDPEPQKSIRGLEAMLRVRDSLGSGQSPPLVPVTKVSASLPAGSGAVETDAVHAMLESAAGAVENDAVPALSERVAGLVETDAVPALLEIAAARAQKRCIDPGTGDVRRVLDSGRLRGVAGAAAATAGESEEIIALPEVTLAKVKGLAVASATAGVAAGESQRIIGLRESQLPSLNSSGWLSVHACASLPAVPGVSARVCPVTSSSALSAAVVHACSTPMHDAHNSCTDTALNSLRVQRYRKVRQSRTVGIRSVEQTVDMSPAPAAGTYQRSAGTVHAQRQVPWECLAESSGGGPGPGPGSGPGGRSGLVGGVSGLAAACLEIPCSLVMPHGRHQFAPQSPGWGRVCGTEKSGIWVLKGDARTYNLPRNLDDVGVVWELRSGYETAWATPGHVCSCSFR